MNSVVESGVEAREVLRRCKVKAPQRCRSPGRFVRVSGLGLRAYRAWGVGFRV